MNPTFQLIRIEDNHPYDCVYVERPIEPLTTVPDPDEAETRGLLQRTTVRVPLHDWSYGRARARVGIVEMRMVPPDDYRGLEYDLPVVTRVYYRGSETAAMLGALAMLKWGRP